MTTSNFPSLTELNRRTDILEVLKGVDYPGLIAFSGSTGAGVSTTLAAIGADFERDGYKVLSVRIDHDDTLPGLTEIAYPEVNSGLIRAVLGVHQPDVVIIDDLRSPETIRFAVDLALKDALVIVGMHAASPESAVERLVQDAGGDNITRAVAEVLIMSVHQQMVKTADGENSEAHLKAVGKAENLMSMANPSRAPFAYREDRKVVSSLLITVPLKPWEPPALDAFASSKKFTSDEEFLVGLGSYVVPGEAK